MEQTAALYSFPAQALWNRDRWNQRIAHAVTAIIRFGQASCLRREVCP